MAGVKDARILDLPKIEDPRGNLSIIQRNAQIPFEIKRVYWIYDVPGGKDRGGHAFKENQEFIVALSGSFDVILDDGEEKRLFHLNRSYFGLYVPKGLWRTMTNFSTNSLALVLSPIDYDPDDYIMDYDEFLKWRKAEPDKNDTQKQVKNMPDGDKKPSDSGEKLESIPSIFDCSLLTLNRNHDAEGNLTYIYGGVHVPFPVRRVFYSYDIPGGEDRGAHAHKHCHQFIIAASGAFDVELDDGVCKRSVHLDRPFRGLHVPPGIWASEKAFSSGSICLVLASEDFAEDDYIRNYDDFLKIKN